MVSIATVSVATHARRDPLHLPAATAARTTRAGRAARAALLLARHPLDRAVGQLGEVVERHVGGADVVEVAPRVDAEVARDGEPHSTLLQAAARLLALQHVVPPVTRRGVGRGVGRARRAPREETRAGVRGGAARAGGQRRTRGPRAAVPCPAPPRRPGRSPHARRRGAWCCCVARRRRRPSRAAGARGRDVRCKMYDAREGPAQRVGGGARLVDGGWEAEVAREGGGERGEGERRRLDHRVGVGLPPVEVEWL
eukprot:scaffold63769_cov48-Phaeocystis_antarctica.AAC.1